MKIEGLELTSERYNELHENVERGAALLDEKIPGWESDVRGFILNGMFRMNSWESCVIGSVERAKYFYRDVTVPGAPMLRQELVIQFNGTELVSESEAERHGFMIGFEADEYAGVDVEYFVLERLWRAEIQSRFPDEEISE